MSVNMRGHTGIVGMTRSGKTVLGNYLFEKTGGLFIDIEDKNEVQGAVTLTKNTRPDQFDRALIEHKKVRYVPDPDPDKAIREATWISKRLLTLNLDLHVWVDELQNYGGARVNAFDLLAVRGLKHGIHLNWLTQRPAKASKTIASQTNTLIFFDMSGFEKKYFKEYELPYDEIKEKLEGQPPYHFVIFTRGVGVSEPRKLSL